MTSHHRRIGRNANVAVSWSIPTLAHPSLRLRSYTPSGVAFPFWGMRKSWTRTGSGSPCGRHSRPPFLESPTSSHFFVSTEIAGW